MGNQKRMRLTSKYLISFSNFIDTLLLEIRDLKNSDIDLTADYSDDDDKVRIGEKELMDYLQKLEENNLFKMNLIQESQ